MGIEEALRTGKKIKAKVLDTNEIIDYPDKILEGFKPKEDAYSVVVVPPVVLREIDRFKSFEGDRGYGAREFTRNLKGAVDRGSQGEFGLEAVLAENCSVLVPRLNEEEIDSVAEGIDVDCIPSGNDGRITALALYLRRKLNWDVEVITSDLNLGVSLKVLGIESNPFQKGLRVKSLADLHKGYSIISIEEEFYRFQKIDEKAKHLEGLLKEMRVSLFPNDFVVVCPDENRLHRPNEKYVLFQNKEGEIRERRLEGERDISFVPRNVFQKMAMILLMDRDTPMVFLYGPAGTGKTYLSAVYAFSQVIFSGGGKHCKGRESYEKIIISRPMSGPEEDLGYLPGDINEKFGPWTAPFRDQMEVFDKERHYRFEDLVKLGQIEMVPLVYIGGRSFSNSILAMDEAQGSSNIAMKWFLTRAGENSKAIVIGDLGQTVSRKGHSSLKNGLVYALHGFRDSSLAGTVYFPPSACVRSRLAAEALRRL